MNKYSFFKSIRNGILAILLVGISLTSCVKDLDTAPIDPNLTATSDVFSNPDSYIQALAKLYSGLAVTGQKGPDGAADITGVDEGFASYLRQLWCATELTTDEAVLGWGDAGLQDYHNQNWSSSNPFITTLYNRIYFQISQCNSYLRDTKSMLPSLSGDLLAKVKVYRAEARFLRALSYYHAIDLFGNVPFVDENSSISISQPAQIKRADLFMYIESELKAVVGDATSDEVLIDATKNEYGRADKGAAWTLLAKLYLNAEVYTGTPKYTESITYGLKVANTSGYSLATSFPTLFMADNDKQKSEIILPIRFDGLHTQTWGGMTFIIHSAIGGNMNIANFGLSTPWAGMRVTKSAPGLFADQTSDARNMFFSNGQSLEIKDITKFADGYAVTKFTNKKSDGTDGSDKTFVDTDFPLLRLADVYLMLAEAQLRGGSGITSAQALDFAKKARVRAGVTSSFTFDLNFILDERGRELLWECSRRSDLIRFGRFSESTYLWPWKGGVSDGISTPKYLNVFPLPSTDISANPKLTQNTGY